MPLRQTQISRLGKLSNHIPPEMTTFPQALFTSVQPESEPESEAPAAAPTAVPVMASPPTPMPKRHNSGSPRPNVYDLRTRKHCHQRITPRIVSGQWHGHREPATSDVRDSSSCALAPAQNSRCSIPHGQMQRGPSFFVSPFPS
jgi:hypothetical protein